MPTRGYTRHRRRHSRSAALFAVIICSRALVAGAAPGRQELKLDSLLVSGAGSTEHTVDVGDARVEDETTEVLDVVNNTPTVFSATTLSTSCGCTSASLDPMKIKPGGEAKLILKVSTGRIVGLKTVEVTIKDERSKDRREFAIAIKLHVCAVFALDGNSPEITLGRLDAAQSPTTHDIAVGKGASSPLAWDGLAVDSDNPQLAATVEPRGSQGWTLRLAIDHRGRVGPFAGDIRLRALNRGADTGYAVGRRVLATFVGPVRAAPGAWLIGQANPGRPVEQAVHILPSGSSDEQPRFLDASSSDAKAIHVVEDAPAKDRFLIRYKPPEKLGPDSGFVDARVSTVHGTYTIRIPYLALVVDAGPAAAGPTPTLAPPKDSDDPDGSP